MKCLRNANGLAIMTEAIRKNVENSFMVSLQELITGKPYVPPPPPPPPPIDIEKLRAEVAAGLYVVGEVDVYGHGSRETYAYVDRKDKAYCQLPKRYLEAILADFAKGGASK